MKLAYCISGQPRFITECAPNHLAVIESFQNEGFEVDIYCQSWTKNNHIKAPCGGYISGDDEDFTVEYLTQTLQKTYSPKHIIVIDQKEWAVDRVQKGQAPKEKTPLMKKFGIHPQVYAHGIIADYILERDIPADLVIKTRYDVCILEYKDIGKGRGGWKSMTETPTKPYAYDMFVERITTYGLPSIRDLVIIGNRPSMIENYTTINIDRAQQQVWYNPTIRSQVPNHPCETKLRATQGWYLPHLFGVTIPEIGGWPLLDPIQMYRRWHQKYNFDPLESNSIVWSNFEKEIADKNEYPVDNI